MNKSLYGLKRSGRNWNVVLHNCLVENEFVQSSGGACVYFGRPVLAIILIWVDDIIIAAKTIEIMNKIKEFLKNKFKMKDMGKIRYFLGIHFQQFEDKITMDQSQYLSLGENQYQYHHLL